MLHLVLLHLALLEADPTTFVQTVALIRFISFIVPLYMDASSRKPCES